MMRRSLLHTAAALLLPLMLLPALLSCSDDEGSSLYSSQPAFLKFSPVTAVAPLYTALHSTGCYCTVRVSTSTFQFAGSDGTSASYPLTAVIQNYGTPVCVAGFIVGTPSVPDMDGQTGPLCYELSCPNCDGGGLVARAVTLGADETATCARCRRTYLLSSGYGNIIKGENGERLRRYRMSYTADLLLVMN